MIDCLEVTTRYTGDTLRTDSALSDAKEIYSSFGGLHYPEALARLALRELPMGNIRAVRLVTGDITDRLYAGGYLEKSKSSSYLTTQKGIVAINMVSVDYFDGSDFDLSLREPFIDLTILDKLARGEPL